MAKGKDNEKNVAQTEETTAAAGSNRYSERRWMSPTNRAKGYAEERKAKVHKFGKKEGEELTEYDKGIRSGYLLCQSDHAGLFKFKKAIAEGKPADEAFEISKVKGKGNRAA